MDPNAKFTTEDLGYTAGEFGDTKEVKPDLSEAIEDTYGEDYDSASLEAPRIAGFKRTSQDGMTRYSDDDGNFLEGKTQPNTGGGTFSVVGGPASDQPGYAEMPNQQKIAANVKAYDDQTAAIYKSMGRNSDGTRIAQPASASSGSSRSNLASDLTDIRTPEYRMMRSARMQVQRDYDQQRRDIKNSGMGQKGKAKALANLQKQFGERMSEEQGDVLAMLGMPAKQQSDMDIAQINAQGRQGGQGSSDLDMAKFMETMRKNQAMEGAAKERNEINRGKVNFEQETQRREALDAIMQSSGLPQPIRAQVYKFSAQNPGISPAAIEQEFSAELARAATNPAYASAAEALASGEAPENEAQAKAMQDLIDGITSKIAKAAQ